MISTINDIDKITFIQTHDMTCMDAVVATLGTWWGRGYEMVYSKSWDFDFQEDPENSLLVGQRICLKEDVSSQSLLEEFHGIQSQSYFFTNVGDTIEFLIKELALGHPLITIFDELYLPWATKSKDEDLNRKGFLLLLDYNKDNGSFTFIDVHSSKKIHSLPYNIVKNGIESFSTGMGEGHWHITSFIRMDAWNPSVEWKVTLREIVQSLRIKNASHRDAFESIDLFAESIKNVDLNLEVQDIQDYESYYFSDLCANLREATRRRKLFSLSLDYMFKRTKIDELQMLSNYMAQAASKWQVSLSVLSKAVLQKDLNSEKRTKIADLLHDACSIERNVADRMESIQYLTEVLVTADKEYSTLEQNNNSRVFVNLKGYFNNRGMGNDKIFADFDGNARGFILEEEVENSFLRKENMEFWIPHYETTDEDNIICASQVIIPPKESFDNISILCCGEWGHYFEKIIIQYCDGDQQELFVNFYEWTLSTSLSNDTQIFKGSSIDQSNDEHWGAAYLFGQSYKLNGDKELLNILLPDSPHSHIFSITLEKVI
ncbi:hypothetical protein A8L34_14070 [Bacillus sp. FJAT-27264]|uniref:hypothetical protein n=1 Tax=Paenibacillus sp. (strain DSM 101736 / FJAT-27264) TaxID=1850362 RepID=UPI000807ABDB|nr:hypothetical protein [Bacillus sp. FJAT-27264]OBZ15002.1 hypothetical protein A8L34_14070 [Bacillus sp. FJAT-27264]